MQYATNIFTAAKTQMLSFGTYEKHNLCVASFLANSMNQFQWI